MRPCFKKQNRSWRCSSAGMCKALDLTYSAIWIRLVLYACETNTREVAVIGHFHLSSDFEASPWICPVSKANKTLSQSSPLVASDSYHWTFRLWIWVFLDNFPPECWGPHSWLSALKAKCSSTTELQPQASGDFLHVEAVYFLFKKRQLLGIFFVGVP